MKVIVSAGGRFHSFRLASQLYKRGILKKIITYSFNPDRDRISRNKVVNFRCFRYIDALMNKIPQLKLKINYNAVKDTLFDKTAIRYIDKCDIFHGWANYSLFCLRRAKAMGAVTLLERSCPHILEQKKILEEEYYKFGIKLHFDKKYLLRMLNEYEEADYIVVCSSYTYNSFLKRGFNKNKLVLLHLGYPYRLNEIKINNNKIFRVLFVGGVLIRKGLLYLLEAWRKLNLSKAELVLRADFSPVDRKIFKKYLHNPTIKIVPFIKNLNELYTNCSILVQPSIDEGFGMPVIEAMGNGLPVIVTENVGAKDFVVDGKNGFIVPIRNVDALCEKILFFYKNEKKTKEMGNLARERVREYTWDRYGENVVKHYERMLRKGGFG